MPISQHQCEGCGDSFTEPGLRNHLVQTWNPPCMEVCRTYLAFVPWQRSLLPMLDTQTDSDVEDQQPSPFPGDFYGQDYAEADFNWDEQGSDDLVLDDNMTDESGDGSELDFNIFEDESSWEPPVEPFEGSESPFLLLGTDVEIDLSDDDDSASLFDQRQVALDKLQKTPFIKEFNEVVANARAGLPVTKEEHGYLRYSNAIADTKQNIWAPFTSYIDWAIAQWAKICGPSSTAFSELLSIEGVSVQFHNIHFD
jgi:hypothetical protein